MSTPADSSDSGKSDNHGVVLPEKTLIKNHGFVHFNQMYQLSTAAAENRERLISDLYLPDEPSSLFAAIQLKEKFGGKIGWYVREHPDLRQRVSTFSTFESTNLPYFDLLYRMTESVQDKIDFAICTGKGYEALLTEMGIEAININRIFSSFQSGFSPEFTKNFLNLPTEAVIIAYPCNIYLASDFSQVGFPLGSIKCNCLIMTRVLRCVHKYASYQNMNICSYMQMVGKIIQWIC